MILYPFFVLLVAILWGMTGTVQTFLDSGVSPIAIVTNRSTNNWRRIIISCRSVTS